MDRSLADIGHKIYRLLDELAKKDFGVKVGIDDTHGASLILHEGERFKVWALNTGLFVPGHGSLDYRVREADGLARTMRAFLDDLVESLEEVLDLESSDDGSSQPEHSFSQEDQIGDVNDGDVPILVAYGESIQDIIHRLFRLSIKLRNPSTRSGLSKALHFRSMDGNVDLFEMYQSFDIDYVCSIFRQYQYGLVQIDANGESQQVAVSSQIRHDYLVKRVAEANGLRRRQFAYWKHHRLKLEQHSALAIQAFEKSMKGIHQDRDASVALQQPDIPPPLSISTATQLQPAMTDYEDKGSIMSISEYTPSLSFEADNIKFPQAPPLKETEKFFECPYCFTTCARHTTKSAAWRAHLIHDLRPYICTYEECKMPHQLYDSRVEWIQHELSHRSFTRNPPSFQEPAIRDSSGLPSDRVYHANIALQNTTAVQATMPNLDRPCPVCKKQNIPQVEIQDHVAAHLERLALFSLPRSTDIEDDDTEQNSKDADVDEGRTQGDSLSQSLNFDQRDAQAQHVYSDQSEVTSAIDEDELERIPAENDSKLETAHYLSNIYHDQGKLEQAEQMYSQALVERENALGPDHPSTLDKVNGLGLLYRYQDKLEQSEQMYSRVLAGKEKALEPDHPSTLDKVNNLGLLYRDQGRLVEAEQMYSRVLAGKEKALEPDHPSTLETVNNLGLLYRDQGRLVEAEQMYVRALAGYEKALEPDHPSTLGTVNNLGLLYRDQGKLVEAEQMYVRALAGYEKALEPDHPSTLETVNNLGLLYHRQGKLVEAEQMYVRALVGSEKALGANHPSTLGTVNNLGELYRDQGRLVEAEQMYLRALVGWEKARGPDHPLTLGTVKNLSILYADRGRLDEAEHYLQRVVVGWKKTFGSSHQKTLQAANDLNKLRTQRADREKGVRA